MIIFLAASVIVISLLSANVGLLWLTRPFRRSHKNAGDEERELRSSSAQAAIAAIDHVVEELGADSSNPELYAQAGRRLANHYRRLVDLSNIARSSGLLRKVRGIESELRLAALDAERKELYRISTLGIQNEELIRKLVYEIDLQESQLCARHKDQTIIEKSTRGASD
jgi:hypothetical protein